MRTYLLQEIYQVHTLLINKLRFKIAMLRSSSCDYGDGELILLILMGPMLLIHLILKQR